MTQYLPHKVSLSEGQMKKLSKALNDNAAITIRLNNNELTGPHELMLTKTQINHLKEAKSNGTGADIQISKSQVRKVINLGGNLFSMLYKAAVSKKVRNKMIKDFTPSTLAGDPMAKMIVGSGSTYGDGLAVSPKPPGAKRRPIKKQPPIIQGGNIMPQNLMPFKRPPPFFGTWEDMRGKGLSVPKKIKIYQ